MVVTAVHLWSLTRFPSPFVDEAWNANRAWALLREGIPYGSLDAGVFERFEGYWSYTPLIPTALHAAAIWIVGAPLLLALRAETLAFGVLLLVACYRIGRSAGGRHVGALAVLLTSLSSFFLLSAHIARSDIMVAAAGYWSIALIITNTRHSPAASALAGLLTGVAFEIHPHASVFILPALAVYVMQSGFGAVRRSDVWAWVCGVFAGASLYIALHVLPYPQTFLAIAAIAHGPTHAPPIATLDPGVLAASVRQTIDMLIWNLPWFGAWTIAVLARVFRWNSCNVLAALAASVVAGVLMLVRNKFTYYGILVSPALDLVLAAFLCESLSRLSTSAVLSRVVAVAALLVGLTVSAATVARSRGEESLRAALEVIAPCVRPDDVLMGPQTYWFGLQEHRYLSWEQLVYHKRLHPTATVGTALRELGPDVLIVDDHLRHFLRDDMKGSYEGHLNVSRREMDAALAASAHEVMSARVPTYGTIKVYRFTWSHSTLYPNEINEPAPLPGSSR